MAILKQRLDGGYYVSGSLPGGKGFCTWQVSKDGVEALSKRGIKVGSNLDPQLLRELIDSKFLFTYKSGLSSGPSNATEEEISSQQAHLTLKDIPNPPLSKGWSLGLKIPEFPSEWISDYETIKPALSKCYLKLVENRSRFQASALTLCHQSAQLSVSPKVAKYALRAEGTWPTEWDLSPYTTPIEGLNPEGTLFRILTDRNFRLRSGAVILPGKPYYFLFSDRICGARKRVHRPPENIVQRKLALENDWDLWVLSTPLESSKEVQDWCNSLGYILRETGWKAKIVSPPANRISDDGRQVFATQNTIVLQVTTKAISDDAQLQIELIREDVILDKATITVSPPENKRGKSTQLLIAIDPLTPGNYAVRELSIQFPSFKFVVEEREFLGTDHSESHGLSVLVKSTDREFVFNCFKDGYGPHAIPISFTSTDEPIIELICPIPLRASVELNGKRRTTKEPKSAKDVEARLQQYLQKAISNKANLNIQLNAGNFGALSFVFSNVEKAHSGSRQAANRLRWLKAIVTHYGSNLRDSRDSRPVPQFVLNHLKTLGGEDIRELPEHCSIPKELFSYCMTLYRSIKGACNSFNSETPITNEVSA